MHSTEEINKRIEIAFSELEFPPAPAGLYEPIAYTLALGGKRLRPMLVLSACELFGGNIEEAIYPAVGIELFHNFTLLHDDLMDQAPLRRGKETVYKKWNPNIAILAGDTMFALANRYMIRTRPEKVPALLDLFNLTAVQVCEGQQHDMNFESEEVVPIAAYLEMIRLKTAVLLAASLRSGALIAGATEAHCKLIYDFGIHIGLAFQLMDDLLDLYSNDEKFGKVKGGDILAAKKTFLYLKALELAGNEAAEFRLLYQSPSGNATEKVQKVRAFFDSKNIEEFTRNEISNCWVKALDTIKSIGLPAIQVQPLVSYCAKLMQREY